MRNRSSRGFLPTSPPTQSIRVWVPGCSTGEEAYSIAILLQEQMEALKQSFQVQVFATDIDSRAIEQARAGVYPASIAADVSPERLARFFAQEPDGSAYRIHKGIRDMLVFSEQDVIKDPPFSKLDLISCRNLLIYMSGELQKKLIPLFHYALNPGGFLFLGTSETVGEFDGPVCHAGSQVEAVSTQRGRSRRPPPGHGQDSPAPDRRRASSHGPQEKLPAKAISAARADRTGDAATVRPGRCAGQRNAARYSTFTAAPACTWNRPRARPA